MVWQANSRFLTAFRNDNSWCPEDWNGQHVRVEFETTEGTEGHGGLGAGAKSGTRYLFECAGGKGIPRCARNDNSESKWKLAGKVG